MNMAQRIRQQRKLKRMNQTQLAKSAGVSQQLISKLEKGTVVETSTVVSVASALGVTAEWLKTGNNPHWLATEEGKRIADTQNTQPGPLKVGRIPLISWIQAGNFCTSPDLLAPGDAEDWLPTVKRHSPHSYALRVKGDSMVAPYPGQRTFLPGSIIYVDPETPVNNGSLVIVKIHDTEEATFKMYSEDGSKRYLRPLNPQFPVIEMTEDMTICGVVVGCYTDI